MGPLVSIAVGFTGIMDFLMLIPHPLPTLLCNHENLKDVPITRLCKIFSSQHLAFQGVYYPLNIGD